MTREEVRVSQDRIGVLIGKAGATKKSLEEKTGSMISVDSKEGVVAVEGEDAQGVISGSRGRPRHREGVLPRTRLRPPPGRGPDPRRHRAQRARRHDPADGPDRGRVIGKDGRSREQIEDMTGTAISVHGKTVAIIGSVEQTKTARTAVEMLLNGVPHETVYAFLDRKKREAKQDLLGSYY